VEDFTGSDGGIEITALHKPSIRESYPIVIMAF
jgi:hypothetical protein